MKFELTEQTPEAVEAWIATAKLTTGDYLFPSRVHSSSHISTQEYARIVKGWAAQIGLDPASVAPIRCDEPKRR